MKVEGLGTGRLTFPWMARSISSIANTALTNGLLVPGTFNGRIMNRANIGKTADELVVTCNAANPQT